MKKTTTEFPKLPKRFDIRTTEGKAFYAQFTEVPDPSPIEKLSVSYSLFERFCETQTLKKTTLDEFEKATQIYKEHYPKKKMYPLSTMYAWVIFYNALKSTQELLWSPGVFANHFKKAQGSKELKKQPMGVLLNGLIKYRRTGSTLSPENFIISIQKR